jgi:hypothetical protein
MQPVLPTTSVGRLHELTTSQGAHAQIEAPTAAPTTDGLDEVDSPPKELPREAQSVQGMWTPFQG